jgi:cytochrome c-type biogenesis protein CcmE|tara:strand:+ start:124 stop:549 length:426 start_codon:yes stop_codon:yes gene_type:complete
MFTQKVKLRIIYSIILAILASAVLYITLKSLEENVVYFYSPTDIYNKTSILSNTTIRVGGLVKEKSINKKGTSINFIITDLKNEIIISYKGLVPNLFSEGKGVIAEGKLKDKKYFVADKILAKHDENYMPPEVKKALEDSK